MRFILIIALATTACAKPNPTASTANPHATKTAIHILKKNGSAIDAAIAAQMILNLVEPQSSGIGGGGFLLHWNAKKQKLHSYDGRETAPANIKPSLFLNPQKQPLAFPDAMIGGIAAGTPGLLAMLQQAHNKHGKLPWRDLFQPAIKLAEKGFPISPRLRQMLARDPILPKREPSRSLYYQQDKNGKTKPLPSGAILKNPKLAQTFRQIAEQGAAAFYQGAIAQNIAKTIRSAKHRPGTLSPQDLAQYKPKMRPNLCRPYRNFTVCAMPPPSSGGVTLLQILGILERFPMSAMKPQSLEAVHLISEASRLAYADRAHYLADPDFIAVPQKALLKPNYLKARAAMISPHRAMTQVPPGNPLAAKPPPRQKGDDLSLPSTTHISVLDGEGNAVSLTSSIEGPFGNHLMSGGFFLNNQLTDFAFAPQKNGRAVANAPAPKKRPLSSMTPTLIFDEEGALFAILGSPGGSRIIAYVAESVIALIDWNMTMQEAIDLPRFVAREGVARGGGLELEQGTALANLKDSLEKMGHQTAIRPLVSGLHGIRIHQSLADGGADRRREGLALTLSR